MVSSVFYAPITHGFRYGFFMIWLGAPGNESSLVMVISASVFVAIALAISTGIFSAFRKKILLQEEKINNLQQQIKSQVDGS